MNGILKTIVLITICLMMLVTASATAQECGEYEVTVIAGFQCGDHLAAVVPWAINETWEVVGYTSCNFFQQAFLWTAKVGLQSIPMPDGTSKSHALAISGSKIVGLYTIPGNGFGHQGFLYDYETDEFTSLGTLKGGNWSEAHDINSSGQIAGYWGNVITGPWKAFLWENGEMIDLGPSIGGANNQAFGINESGAITGWMGQAPTVDSHAFIWNEGKVTELPVISGGITSQGNAINNHGDVAGRGWFFDSDINANVWRAFAFIDGETINLGTLPGIERSVATGINDNQIIVGFAQIPPLLAFIWKDGEMTELNDLIPPSENLNIQVARGINQTGQIAVHAHSEPLNATVGVVLTLIEGPLGDLNNDCQITTTDLLFLFGEWGPCNACPADLDGNGMVNTSDLLILFSNWG